LRARHFQQIHVFWNIFTCMNNYVWQCLIFSIFKCFHWRLEPKFTNVHLIKFLNQTSQFRQMNLFLILQFNDLFYWFTVQVIQHLSYHQGCIQINLALFIGSTPCCFMHIFRGFPSLFCPVCLMCELFLKHVVDNNHAWHLIQ